MRKISWAQVGCFTLLVAVALLAGWLASYGIDWVLDAISPNHRPSIGIWLGVTYLFSFLVYRAYLAKFPLREGPIAKNSPGEFHYHVYLLFFLILYQPLIRSLFVPVPIMRVVYQALGCRLGRNTYSAGVILDPPLTSLGDGCIVGHDAVLFCHAVEGDQLSLAPIHIGNGVTIGAKAVVQPGVTIGDGAIVAVGSVVRKHTRIGSNETWGGVPARMLHPGDATVPRPEAS